MGPCGGAPHVALNLVQAQFLNASGRWSTLMYVYGGDRASLLTAACEGCGHRIRACRNRLDCSDRGVWP